MLRPITSLYEFFEVFPDEQAAIDHLRSIRWAKGAYCPYCGSTRVMHFGDNRTHKCHECRQRFSIKVGTIFEDTKLPLRKWFAAIWLITGHKKGIASTALAKDLKITQKSAWFVLHRLRYAARTRSFNRPLEGTVEVDESYFGPKEHNRHASQRKKGKAQKTIVLGMVERGGEIRAATIKNLQGRTVRGRVFDNVKDGSNLMTDEHVAYIGLRGPYSVQSVNHSARRIRSRVLSRPYQHHRRGLGPVQASGLRHPSPRFAQASRRLSRRNVLPLQPPRHGGR